VRRYCDRARPLWSTSGWVQPRPKPGEPGTTIWTGCCRERGQAARERLTLIRLESCTLLAMRAATTRSPLQPEGAFDDSRVGPIRRKSPNSRVNSQPGCFCNREATDRAPGNRTLSGRGKPTVSGEFFLVASTETPAFLEKRNHLIHEGLKTPG